MAEIKTVGILGAGTMGNGIAHVCARAGHDVVLYDLQQDFLDRGMATIGKNLAREVAKNKLTEEQAEAAKGRIRPTLSRDELGRCGWAIEAATERFAVKAESFGLYHVDFQTQRRTPKLSA